MRALKLRPGRNDLGLPGPFCAHQSQRVQIISPCVRHRTDPRPVAREAAAFTRKTFMYKSLALSCLVAVCGHAIATPVSEAQARYKEDRAMCMRGETNQDRATCLKEAGAALQDAKNLAVASSPDLKRNRLKRCEGLPSADREECAARMDLGTTSGSAQGGGILRELTSPVK
jgi:hypothetical protein